MFERGKAIREAKKREILAKATREARQEAMQQGIERGIEQGRQQSNAKWRALAEKYGIPESEMPFGDEDLN